MQPGDRIDLDVTGVAHGGVFVARHEGRVVFVPDTLPGERIRAVLTETGRASYWRAELLEVLDAAPARRPHIWPEADASRPAALRPGGADFGHIALAEQRELKRTVLADAMTRIGGSRVPVTMAPPRPATGPGGVIHAEAADGARWRTRVGLHSDGKGSIGPYAARSHTIVPVRALPLAVPELEAAAERLPQTPAGRVDLVASADGEVRVLLPGMDRSVQAPVTERAGGRSFAVSADGFWQVHRLAADTLSAMVGEELDAVGVDPDAEHLDLYGGVGLFAAALAERAGPRATVVTVESDAAASAHARRNLADLPGVDARAARVERWITAVVADADRDRRERLGRGIVVLDPPRRGAGPSAVDAIAALRPAAVVYVACDPAALARDVRRFAEAGYRAAAVRGVDLFPHSHHVEAVVTLLPADPRIP